MKKGLRRSSGNVFTFILSDGSVGLAQKRYQLSTWLTFFSFD